MTLLHQTDIDSMNNQADWNDAFDEFNKKEPRTQSYFRAAVVQKLVREGVEINKTNIDNELYARWVKNGKSWSEQNKS
jgi:hypothetical protein